MEQETLNVATNMANLIGSCNVTIAQLQVENQKLKNENQKLKITIDNLRKEGANVPRDTNLTDQQIGYSDK
ncbi:hypothetical protein [Lactobacillus sp.]|uniref:hypothetical protein n=1 Tax=Lactobacillus sp. TaxID=1591 RepID=UPI0019B9E81F|nr:hypothetical protein [Lactobacillus sp.]MBD5429718.1 hypothetical protein [Lactobacillus sp.]